MTEPDVDNLRDALGAIVDDVDRIFEILAQILERDGITVPVEKVDTIEDHLKVIEVL